jgi:hypothetical protein
VPTDSALAANAVSASASGGPHPSKLAGTTLTGGFTLLQLTPTGWQTVVNGQLIPYATGVLGDQLAAQTILNNTDTTTLKGAEFCVGYGSSAQDMVSNGDQRTVATIPLTTSDGPSAPGGTTTASSCIVGGTVSVGINLVPGWNLLGNPVSKSLSVADKFGDASKVTSVWKWDSGTAKWQFYTPSLTADALQSFALGQGYGVLSEISGGDGYWVNAKALADLGTVSGTAINLRPSSLTSGWNLVATANATTPQKFNLSLSTTPPTAGQVPVNMTSLWAWDSAQSKWLFYAPSLEATGDNALLDFINSQHYEDFAAVGKNLGNSTGFWVQRP